MSVEEYTRQYKLARQRGFVGTYEDYMELSNPHSPTNLGLTPVREDQSDGVGWEDLFSAAIWAPIAAAGIIMTLAVFGVYNTVFWLLLNNTPQP